MKSISYNIPSAEMLSILKQHVPRRMTDQCEEVSLQSQQMPGVIKYNYEHRKHSNLKHLNGPTLYMGHVLITNQEK